MNVVAISLESTASVNDMISYAHDIAKDQKQYLIRKDYF